MQIPCKNIKLQRIVVDIVDFQIVMAVIIREQGCEWIENYLKLWDKLQKNMERFSYFQDNKLIIQGAEAIVW
jgi:hypothetical protein